MAQHFNRKATFLAVGVIISVASAAVLLKRSFQQAIDLGAVPPAQAFTRVFKMPVPKGVSQLKVAGEAHLSGVVWMRFQVANMDAFLHSLRKHGVVLEPADELWIHTANIRSSHYAAMVEWECALLIANPRRYRFSM